MEAKTYEAAKDGYENPFRVAICTFLRPAILLCEVCAIDYAPALVRLCGSGPEFLSNQFVTIFQNFMALIKTTLWDREFARYHLAATIELPGFPQYDFEDAFDVSDWGALEMSISDQIGRLNL